VIACLRFLLVEDVRPGWSPSNPAPMRNGWSIVTES
jgi:hypothetical protein